MRYAVRAGFLFLTSVLLSACAVIPGDSKYPGPPPRPAAVLDYYAYDNVRPYNSVSEQVVTEKENYVHKRLVIGTDQGPINVEYYDRRRPTKNLVFVFPILGGKNVIEGYFAKYFANRGFNTAIVHRDKDFKNPELFDTIEDVFRKNVIRDRVAMDYFEREAGMTTFGSFGISRGAINAAITAGVDSRLEFNVLAMGGTDIVEVFKKTNVGGVRRYRESVEKAKNITTEEFYSALESNIKTDPKNLARYMDARNTMMVLSVFDQSVPFKYGMRLRRQIGHPKTVFLAAGHVTSILYTQVFPLLLPSDQFCLFPFDFVESQALDFYNSAFDTKQVDFWHLPFKLVQLPILLLGKVYYALF